jgi:hypothetical protein
MTDREHRHTEGQGFDDPHEGFDLDPAELTVDLDPSQIDPADSHALPDLLDEGSIPKDAVDAEEFPSGSGVVARMARCSSFNTRTFVWRTTTAAGITMLPPRACAASQTGA